MVNGINLILASASPRREELLERLGLAFEVVPSRVEEDERPGARPAETALRLAQMKAQASAMRTPGNGSKAELILAADTVIEFDGRMLGKPSGPEAAVEMLQHLAGRRHRVITAVCVMEIRHRRTIAGVVASEVAMRDFTREEARRYVSTGEPLDKAGSYAIQGRGSELIAEWSGCYNNIIGLPLCETTRLIRYFEPSTPIDESSCRLPDGLPCPRLAEPGSRWVVQTGDSQKGEHGP